MRQPAADRLADPKETGPAGLEESRGHMLVAGAGGVQQPIAHGQMAGGVIHQNSRDPPAAALESGIQAAHIKPGIDEAQVDGPLPQFAGERFHPAAGTQHREPAVHQRPDRQAQDADAILVGLFLGQARQRAGDHQGGVPGRHDPAGQVKGIPLNPAHSGQILGGEKADGHRCGPPFALSGFFL